MDIQEIISNAKDTYSKAEAGKRMKGSSESDPFAFYADNLLKTYHEELKKSLAEQGIKI